MVTMAPDQSANKNVMLAGCFAGRARQGVIWIVLGLAVFLSACEGLSLRPWFKPQASAIDPELLKTWRYQEEDEVGHFKFSATPDGTIVVENWTEGEEGLHVYEATAARVSDALLLDYLPKSADDAVSWQAGLHRLVRLELAPGKLWIRLPNEETMEKLLAQHGKMRQRPRTSAVRVPYDGTWGISPLLVVDTTESLEEFLRENIDKPGLWTEQGTPLTPTKPQSPPR